MHGHDQKEQDTAKLNRRKFLTKTGAGLIIASMPAKSVWGACSVSGALSGNLSQNTARHDCEMPPLSGGRSPGGWKNLSKKNIDSYFTQLKKIKKSKRYDDTVKKYLSFIDMVKSQTLPLPSELTTVNYTINGGLASNGQGDNNVFYHLSAVYLNAYFGFYTGYSGKQAAEELVTTIFLNWYTQLVKNRSSVNFSESALGYNDGSTDWLLPV